MEGWLLPIAVIVFGLYLVHKTRRDGRALDAKLFESRKSDLVFETIDKHLQIIDYWFVDEEQTIVTLRAENIDVQYCKHSTPGQVIESVQINGNLEYRGKSYLIQPIVIKYSQTEQELIDLDWSDISEVITSKSATLGLEEEILLIVSRKVNEGDFALSESLT